MKSFLLTGFDINKDPIMSSLLYAMQLSQTLSIKKKARILLKDSCVLMGVVDDTGVLGPNQIFCQIRKDSSKKYHSGSDIFKEEAEFRQVHQAQQSKI
jgi:hypothetical protein